MSLMRNAYNYSYGAIPLRDIPGYRLGDDTPPPHVCVGTQCTVVDPSGCPDECKPQVVCYQMCDIDGTQSVDPKSGTVPKNAFNISDHVDDCNASNYHTTDPTSSCLDEGGTYYYCSKDSNDVSQCASIKPDNAIRKFDSDTCNSDCTQ